MYVLDGMIENAIYLLFPIFVYLIYVSYIRNLDKKYFKGKTDYCVSCINDYMMEATGEPLFYLI